MKQLSFNGNKFSPHIDKNYNRIGTIRAASVISYLRSYVQEMVTRSHCEKFGAAPANFSTAGDYYVMTCPSLNRRNRAYSYFSIESDGAVKINLPKTGFLSVAASVNVTTAVEATHAALRIRILRDGEYLTSVSCIQTVTAGNKAGLFKSISLQCNPGDLVYIECRSPGGSADFSEAYVEFAMEPYFHLQYDN